ncbi:MAG: hypothetical protein LBV42_00570 [Methanobrevibacter sp.]|jgi:hypothetical protein|nr:hypothetical protein [Methanobrevibacter sp.]
MKFSTLISLVIVAFILIFGFYLWVMTQNALIEPVGRVTVNKLGNPDEYLHHGSAQVLADYATKTNTKCILVVHYGGDSTYSRFEENDEDITPPEGIYIIELAYVDPSTYRTDVDPAEVIKTFLFGIPDDRYTYKADGIHFKTLDESLKYVSDIAKSRGQAGPIPMFYHGTVRDDNPFINPGCGFPLFTQIAWKEYGRLGAYYYVFKSLLWPFVSNKFYPYQISHFSSLNELYNTNRLNYENPSEYKRTDLHSDFRNYGNSKTRSNS